MAAHPLFVLDAPNAGATMLSACMSAARADALRFFGQQRPPAWKPRARPWPIRWCVMSVLAVATGAFAAAVWPSPAKPRAVIQTSPATPMAASWGPPLAPESAPSGGDARPAAAAAVEVPSAKGDAAIERLGNGELRIQLIRHNRGDAAQRLAALTGTQLLERPEVLSQTRPLSLRWQGRDVASAWRALLTDEAHYLLDCRVDSACKVWVFAAQVSQANASRTPQPLDASGRANETAGVRARSAADTRAADSGGSGPAAPLDPSQFHTLEPA